MFLYLTSTKDICLTSTNHSNYGKRELCKTVNCKICPYMKRVLKGSFILKLVVDFIKIITVNS